METSKLRELELLDLPPIPQYKIALELDYPSLRAFCETTKTTRLGICSEPFFWKKKTYYDFGDFYDIEERSGDWRRNYEYYRDLFSYDLIQDIANDDQEKVNNKLIANDKRKVLNANRQGKNGETALMGAASQGYDIIVRYLLEAGADPNLRNNVGFTALMYASMWGNGGAVQTLLEYGANVNVVDNEGSTALSLVYRGFEGWEEGLRASEGEATNIVRMLLSLGISDINAGRDDSTPLMIAARYGFSEVVKMLLEAGANPNLEDDFGLTALDEAERMDHPEIVEILRKATSK